MNSRKVSFSFRLALLVFASACCIFCVLTLRSVSQITKQANTLSQGTVRSIVLDAGHGGEDGGAVGKSRLLEKDINLAIAQKLRMMLEVSGFEVIMTRESDTFIGNNCLPTLAERKKSDMQARLSIANNHPDSLFLSIHQNHFQNQKNDGAQVFYSKNHPNSSMLSNSIQTSIVSLLQPDNTRQSKAAENTIYLLRNAKSPAVIVECGFLSNALEAQLLCEDAYQNKMAFSILCGVLDYYAGVA